MRHLRRPEATVSRTSITKAFQKFSAQRSSSVLFWLLRTWTSDVIFFFAGVFVSAAAVTVVLFKRFLWVNSLSSLTGSKSILTDVCDLPAVREAPRCDEGQRARHSSCCVCKSDINTGVMFVGSELFSLFPSLPSLCGSVKTDTANNGGYIRSSSVI